MAFPFKKVFDCFSALVISKQMLGEAQYGSLFGVALFSKTIRFMQFPAHVSRMAYELSDFEKALEAAAKIGCLLAPVADLDTGEIPIMCVAAIRVCELQHIEVMRGEASPFAKKLIDSVKTGMGMSAIHVAISDGEKTQSGFLPIIDNKIEEGSLLPCHVTISNIKHSLH